MERFPPSLSLHLLPEKLTLLFGPWFGECDLGWASQDGPSPSLPSLINWPSWGREAWWWDFVWTVWKVGSLFIAGYEDENSEGAEQLFENKAKIIGGTITESRDSKEQASYIPWVPVPGSAWCQPSSGSFSYVKQLPPPFSGQLGWVFRHACSYES